eukprot:gnl/Chilomastix_cuspidata/3229.p1 GENE.gnl/Chilomastix_cuspidata/3229~~gnl/Chilomastix_cuspidata/3229.p1  ORF type:complete len:934 (-),score=363.01 gnl/Chilomastix_cuspidata/3229:78-2879(-)
MEPLEADGDSLFSAQVEALIATSCDEVDAELDAQEFSAAEYVDKQIPNLAALAAVSTLRREHELRRDETNENLHALVRSMVWHQRRDGAAAAPVASVAQIFSMFEQISVGADECGRAVARRIGRARRLHVVKRNIRETVTVMRKFEMLDSALTLAAAALDLRDVAADDTADDSGSVRDVAQRRPDFAAALSPLTAAGEALHFFAAACAELPPCVAALARRAKCIQRGALKLAQALLARVAARDAVAANDAIALTDSERRQLSCAVQVAARAGHAKLRKFLNKFLRNELRAYRARFAPGAGADGLAGVAQRCTWMRSYLSRMVFVYQAAFPRAWRMLDRFAVRWTRCTREGLSAWLGERGIVCPDTELDSAVARQLIAAVVETSDMVKFLEDTFWPDDTTQQAWRTFHAAAAPDDAREEAAREKERQRVLEKWKRLRSGGTDATTDAAAAAESAPASPILAGMRVPPEPEDLGDAEGPLDPSELTTSFRHELMSVFANILGIYVKDESRTMEKAIEDAVREDDASTVCTVVMREINAALEEVTRLETLGLKVPPALLKPYQISFPSAVKVLIIIKESFMRCVGVSNEQPLFDLYRHATTHLTAYCTQLARAAHRSLQALDAGGRRFFSASNKAINGVPEEKVPPMFSAHFSLLRLAPDDVALLTSVGTSCDYIVKNLAVLEEQLRALSNAAFASNISFKDVSRKYADLSVKCFWCILAGALGDAAAILKKWSCAEPAPDADGREPPPSDYVRKASNILRGVLRRIRVIYGASFCRLAVENIATGLVGLLGQAFLSQTRLTNFGACQMRADLSFALAACDAFQDAAGVRLNIAAEVRRNQGALLAASIEIVQKTHSSTVLAQNFIEKIVDDAGAPREHAIAWFPDFTRVLFEGHPAKRALTIDDFKRRIGMKGSSKNFLVEKAKRLGRTQPQGGA